MNIRPEHRTDFEKLFEYPKSWPDFLGPAGASARVMLYDLDSLAIAVGKDFA